MKRLRHPIRAIHEPFGKAGLIVAIFALVFAMLGGAYAATGGNGGKQIATASKKKSSKKKKKSKSNAALTGKQKKEVEKLAKKYAGKPGANGAAGPAGPAGTSGAPGAKGDAGDSGAAGASVTVEEFAGAKEGHCTEGGAKFSVGSEKAFACNGEEGQAGQQGNPGDPGEPWPVGTAPTGAVMKGTWAISTVAASTGEELFVALPTVVPVENGPFAKLIVEKPGNEETLPGTDLCPKGNPEEPQPAEFEGKALPGAICFFTNGESGGAFPASANLQPFTVGGVALSKSHGGAVLKLHAAASGPVRAYGTWAMSTP